MIISQYPVMYSKDEKTLVIYNASKIRPYSESGMDFVQWQYGDEGNRHKRAVSSLILLERK